MEEHAQLLETLFILRKRVDNIQQTMLVMKDNKFHQIKEPDMDYKEGTHFFILFFFVIMEAVSYIVEYEENFHRLVEPKHVDRIKRVKSVTKPVMNIIKEWTDLRNVRNEIYAHGWRYGEDKQFSYHKLQTYNTPRNYNELVLLRKYLLMIQSVIQSEFEYEYDFEVLEYIKQMKAAPVIPPMTPEQIKGKLFSATVAMNKSLRQHDFEIELDFSMIVSDI